MSKYLIDIIQSIRIRICKLKRKQNSFAYLISRHQWSKVLERTRKQPNLAKKKIGKHGDYPLHYTVKSGSVTLEVVKQLLHAYPKAIFHVEEQSQRTLLHLAALYDTPYDSLVHICQAVPVSVTKQDRYGRLPIHYAAYRGNILATKLFLLTDERCGLVQDNEGFLPHHVAAKHSLDTYHALESLSPTGLTYPDHLGRTPKDVVNHYHSRLLALSKRLSPSVLKPPPIIPHAVSPQPQHSIISI